ncbi:short-chain dehydrogenase [Jannaschia sp. EhC01]|nr:short-chain dehydrogenase [Jannaschia sp. EhC01]
MTRSKVAVVAGGTAGVGRTVVDALIKDGYRVGILARGKDRLNEVEATYGDRVMTLRCDVSDARAVSRAGAGITEVLGPIDVWVNCAMLTSFSPFLHMAPQEFEAIVDTTFMGVVNGTRAALSLMRNQGRRQIVTVGSGLCYRSVPFQSAYCASKHAINGFINSLSSELIREGSGITLNLVRLPAINTPQFDWARNRLDQKPQPAPPIFQPEVAARTVMKAVDEGTREIFVGQSVLKLVFGNMALPAWLNRKTAKGGAEMQKSKQDEPGNRPDNLQSPVSDIPSQARGSFGDEVSGSGWIVDADRARIAVFAGLPLVGLVLGLIHG